MLPVTEDTPPDMLAGNMDVRVVLPGGRAVKMAIARSTPMMDLLVQVTTLHKLSAAGHVLQPVGERGVLPYKPSTPIGALDAWTVQVVPKNKVQPVAVQKKMPLKPLNLQNQPFEQTFRLQVHLPRNQLYVMRVSSRTRLCDILQQTCNEKNLDSSKYEMRHPADLSQVLNPSCTLADYGLQEVTVVARVGSDIMALQREEDKRRQQARQTPGMGVVPSKRSRSSTCEGSVSSDSLGGRSISPARSDESVSRSASPPIMAPPARPARKRRPAPKPPGPPEQNPDGVAVSHSRNSSDSSGYHEASILSDGPSDTLPRKSKPQTGLSRSMSSLMGAGPGLKKKKAPPPPPGAAQMNKTTSLERHLSGKSSAQIPDKCSTLPGKMKISQHEYSNKTASSHLHIPEDDVSIPQDEHSQLHFSHQRIPCDNPSDSKIHEDSPPSSSRSSEVASSSRAETPDDNSAITIIPEYTPPSDIGIEEISSNVTSSRNSFNSEDKPTVSSDSEVNSFHSPERTLSSPVHTLPLTVELPEVSVPEAVDAPSLDSPEALLNERPQTPTAEPPVEPIASPRLHFPTPKPRTIAKPKPSPRQQLHSDAKPAQVPRSHSASDYGSIGRTFGVGTTLVMLSQSGADSSSSGSWEWQGAGEDEEEDELDINDLDMFDPFEEREVVGPNKDEVEQAFKSVTDELEEVIRREEAMNAMLPPPITAEDDSLDWEYQLPAPPSAFRDADSPGLTEFSTVMLADAQVFREVDTVTRLNPMYDRNPTPEVKSTATDAVNVRDEVELSQQVSHGNRDLQYINNENTQQHDMFAKENQVSKQLNRETGPSNEARISQQNKSRNLSDIDSQENTEINNETSHKESQQVHEDRNNELKNIDNENSSMSHVNQVLDSRDVNELDSRDVNELKYNNLESVSTDLSQLHVHRIPVENNQNRRNVDEEKVSSMRTREESSEGAQHSQLLKHEGHEESRVSSRPSKDVERRFSNSHELSNFTITTYQRPKDMDEIYGEEEDAHVFKKPAMLYMHQKFGSTSALSGGATTLSRTNSLGDSDAEILKQTNVKRSTSHVSLVTHPRPLQTTFTALGGRTKSVGNLQRDSEPPLQSLQVLRSILPRLSDESAPSKLENALSSNHSSLDHEYTSKSNSSNDTSKPIKEISRVTVNKEERYVYRGPPSVNFTTWSERPKSQVSIKLDGDYRIGVGQAGQTQSSRTSAESKPKPVEPKTKTSETEVYSADPKTWSAEPKVWEVESKPNTSRPKTWTSEANAWAAELRSRTSETKLRSTEPKSKTVECKIWAAEPRIKVKATNTRAWPAEPNPQILQSEHSSVLAALDTKEKRKSDPSRVPIVRAVELKKSFIEQKNLQGSNGNEEAFVGVNSLAKKFSNGVHPSKHSIGSDNVTVTSVQERTVPRRYTSIVGINTASDQMASSTVRVNGFAPPKQLMPVVKGFQFAAPAANRETLGNRVQQSESVSKVQRSESLKTWKTGPPASAPPPPPPPVASVMKSSSRPRPKSLLAPALNPRDQLMDSIRNFGGRENLRQVCTARDNVVLIR